MNNYNFKGMAKEALIDWSKMSVGLENISDKIPYLLAIPAIVGIGAGYIGSKVTSPTDVDKDSIQNEFLREKLRRQVALRTREMELAKEVLREKKREAKSKQRDLMI